MLPKAGAENFIHFVGFIFSQIQEEEVVTYSQLGTIFSRLFTAD